MTRTGVKDFATRKVKKCSGGQQEQQRFTLTLLTDPQLLIRSETAASAVSGLLVLFGFFGNLFIPLGWIRLPV